MLNPVASGVVALSLVGAMTLGAAMPASAATDGPLFPSSSSAYDYALTVRSQDLYGANSAAAKAAWSNELGRVAATDANLYRAAAVYGNIEPGPIGEVIPLTKAVDQSLHGKIPIGQEFSNGVRTWKGTGFKFPRFPSGAWSSVRAAAGGWIGGTVALAAFSQRADIANGVASWVGTDATGAVCSDPVAGGANPINWLTGQDCAQWAAARDFAANTGIVEGVTGGESCSATYGFCITLTGVIKGVDGGAPGKRDVWVFSSKLNGWTGRPSGTLTFESPAGQLNSGFDLCANYGSFGGSYSFYKACYDQKADGYAFLSDLRQYPTGPALLSYKADGSSTAQTVNVTDADPPRVIKCTQYGASGNITNGYTASFKESELAGANLPAPVCLPLPNGEDPNRMVVTETGGGQDNVMYDKTQTDEATDWDAKYKAQCGTGPGQKTCLGDVVVISTGLSCFASTSNCADWFSDPQRDSKYQCQYGGNNEPVSQCYAYANTFDAAKRAAGNPYADPKTGKDTGGNTGVSEDVRTMGNPAGAVISPNGDVAGCWGGGGAGAVFNPVGWIVRGGQCIANWAWVPRPTVVKAAVDSSGTAWDQTVFGKIAVVTAPFASIPVFTGCAGVPVYAALDWPISWHIDWQFGASCSGPMQTAATTVRLISGGILGGSAILALTNYLGVGIGFRGFGRRS